MTWIAPLTHRRAKAPVHLCKRFSRLPCPDGHLKPRKCRYRLFRGFKIEKEDVAVTSTARRSLWLRRTAGAKRRGTNSQSEEAEDHQMLIEARSH